MSRNFRKERLAAALLSFIMVLLSVPTSVFALQGQFLEDDPIHETKFEPNWEKPIVAYGNALSEEEREKTFELLEVSKKSDFQYLEVTDIDVWPFVDALFVTNISSVVVKKGKKGFGVQVYVNTPDTITHVEDFEYANAAITCGVRDCIIIVGACKPATGISALAGVFKIFDLIEPDTINEDAVRVSISELDVIADIKKEEGVILNPSETQITAEDTSTETDASETTKVEKKDDETIVKEITRAMRVLKMEVAKEKTQNPDNLTLDEEKMPVVVKNIFHNQNIELSDRSVNRLMKWLEKYMALETDWEETVKQLEDFDKNKVIEKSGKKYSGFSIMKFLPIFIVIIVSFVTVVLISVFFIQSRKKKKNVPQQRIQ